MINVRSKVVKYLQFYKWIGNSLVYCTANEGDRIAVKIKGKVVSGELYQVGTKYVHLKVNPDRFCGNKQYFYHEKYLIEDIEKIAVYPKCHQKLGVVNCV